MFDVRQKQGYVLNIQLSSSMYFQTEGKIIIKKGTWSILPRQTLRFWLAWPHSQSYEGG